MVPSYPSTSCFTCSVLDDYIEIENAQDPSDTDASESFPDQVKQLRVPNNYLERHYRYKSERLLKCFDCGTYYWYRTWAPGGSEDVLRTYIHESLRRLSFLKAYIELDDIQYQLSQHTQEWVERDDERAARRGAQEEIELLRARYREITWDAMDALEHKYRRSSQLMETLKLYAPHRDHSHQIEEARARDERAAAYHASVLQLHLRYWEPKTIPVELIQRLVSLLVDNNERVRESIRDALLALLEDVSGRKRIAQEVVKAAERLDPRSDEAEALLWACRETGGV